MGRTFTLDFKLNAANYAEINGVISAARKFDVDPKSIREWRLLKNNTTQSQKGTETAIQSNAIKYAKENGIEAAAKEYNVNPEDIREWCCGSYLKGTLKRVPQNNTTRKYKKKSLINVDKKCIRKDIENRLALWIIKQQKNNVLVTKPMIKVKALELFKTKHSKSQETFKVSLNWVQDFLGRKKLNLSCSSVFTLNLKLNVINYAKKNGILTAAKEYNISPKHVREWYNEYNLSNAAKQTKNSLNITSCASPRVFRAFTLDFKLNAIKYAKENGLSAASKEYNVDRKSIFEWCSGRKLKNLGRGRKDINTSEVDKECINEEMENLLALWVNKQQENNILVTKEIIKIKALEILKGEKKENSHISLTWVQGFLTRKKLNLKNNVSTNVQKMKSKSNAIQESSSNVMIKRISEKVDKSLVSTSDLKLVRNDMHKTVKSSKKKLFTQDKEKEFKKRKLNNCVSSYNSHSNNYTSNVVNEDQVSIKIMESFSLNSQLNPTDSSHTKIEQQFKNASCTVKEGESYLNQNVQPMTVQGLIACIAFQTFFNIKDI